MRRKRNFIPRITHTFTPGQLVMFVGREKSHFRVYIPGEPRTKARLNLNVGDIGMYIKLIEAPPNSVTEENDNLYLFGETLILINAEWAEGKIVPYGD